MSRIVYGINPVTELLRVNADGVAVVHYASGENPQIRKILDRCQKSGIKTVKEERSGLDSISGNGRHQGIAALVSDFAYSGVDEILALWRKSGEKAFIIIVDCIQDPHNLGAIIRTAEAAGVHGIIIPKDRAAGVSPAVEKVSTGAVEHMKIARVTNIARTLEQLKKEGLWIIGAEASEGTSLYRTDLNMDMAFVIGSESKGIRPLVKKGCDIMVSIPMKGKINSLNASVSAALVIYEVVRQREPGN